MKNLDAQPGLDGGCSSKVLLICIIDQTFWRFILIRNFYDEAGVMLGCARHKLKLILAGRCGHSSMQVGAVGLLGICIIVVHVNLLEFQRKVRTSTPK